MSAGGRKGAVAAYRPPFPPLPPPALPLPDRREGWLELPPAAELSRPLRPPVLFDRLGVPRPRLEWRDRASAEVVICARARDETASAHKVRAKVFMNSPVDPVGQRQNDPEYP